jgi:hypothetical protein
MEVSNRALIFLQKATLACFNKIAKRQFFLHFCKKHPLLRSKLSKAYETMINSFNTCQECLNNQRFTVIYDEYSHEIQQIDTDNMKAKPQTRPMNLKRISFFSDFVLMQQLMTIEIDILVGRTNNYMRYLDLNYKDAENAVDRNMPSKLTETMHEDGKTFHIDAGVTTNMQQDNFNKIEAVEDRLKHFVSVFSKAADNQQPMPNETFQDQGRLYMMEKYERFGLQLFRKDHLVQYMNFLKGLQREYEIGDFYGAKQHYVNALVDTVYVNHRIRKKTLEHILEINRRIGFPTDSPERALISRYFITQKHVQVLFDASSFPNNKIQRYCMQLPRMLFDSLESQDTFGYKLLKDGFDKSAGMRRDAGILNPNKDFTGLTNDRSTISDKYQLDIIVPEEKRMNEGFKARYLREVEEQLLQPGKMLQRFNKINIVEQQ